MKDVGQEFPEGYHRCVTAMAEAAQLWIKQHPFAELRFNDLPGQMAREAGRPSERAAVIACLSDVIDRWAANEDARLFLQAMDSATAGEGTFLMAKVIVDQAAERFIEHGQGQFPSGDWACSGCGKRVDGFTKFDGTPHVPGPGSPSVCTYCGTLQSVNLAGTGYVPLSVKAINELPKSVRMRLRELQRFVKDRLEREKSRS